MEKYNQIFMEVLKVSEEQLPDLKYKETEFWDSIGHMTMIAEMEEQFGIEFDPDDMIEFDSYQKGIEILKKYHVVL